MQTPNARWPNYFAGIGRRQTKSLNISRVTIPLQTSRGSMLPRGGIKIHFKFRCILNPSLQVIVLTNEAFFLKTTVLIPATMKIVSLFLLVLTTALASLKAQVSVENRPMVTGSQPALVIKLKGAESKFVESEWKEYMKTYGKVTGVKGSKESVVEGTHIRDIGQGELINVYSYAGKMADGTEMVVWFSRGGSYLDAKDKEYPSAELFMKTFAHKVSVDMIVIDLEEQQKKLSRLESDSVKLQKENVNLHGTIETAKGKIAQAEIDIPLNLRSQEAAQTDITNQKAVVESVKDNPEEYKIQQKLLAKLESSFEKLLKENESLHKVVTDANAKIKQAELDLETNLAAQETNSAAIKDQKTVVSLVDKKLDEVRAQKPK